MKDREYLEALAMLHAYKKRRGVDLGDGVLIAKMATIQEISGCMIAIVKAIDEGRIEDARIEALGVLSLLPDWSGDYAAEVAVIRGHLEGQIREDKGIG